MNRIERLFSTKKNRVLNVYCTAGFPELNSTLEVMKALADNGADLIELGIPYSDPLADGPVIQQSGSRAIENGMSIEVLLTQLEDFRESIDVPLILMGYMNPVMQYGFERFCERAAAIGVDGLILPDLPMHEFEKEYDAVLKKYGLSFIFLVTPETSMDRIRKLDGLSSGFLYAVSSSSTTGNEKKLSDQQSYFERLQLMKLNNPVLIGFGIKDKESFDMASRYASGAIIGSAYIRQIEHAEDIELATKTFLSGILS